MSDVKSIVVLGSTGSIGTQTLDLVRQHPDAFTVLGLSSAGTQTELLATQAVEFQAQYISVTTPEAATSLRGHLAVAQATHEAPNYDPEIVIGDEAASHLAGLSCDVVVNGITGAVGLMPTVAALKAGNRLALANKESLVIGGVAVTSLAAEGQIVPVDSEHSAIAQALRSGAHSEIKRIILTASGGPFRGWTSEQLETVTVEQALAHPTWSMGPVVTVNSSTLMNKGLEVIEAKLLFGVDIANIDVVVHPQSVVHSMVEFIDGSTIAQASPPDMHLPIALGMSWPHRMSEVSAPCSWDSPTTWTFEPVNRELFPALTLAYRVGDIGGTAPAVMNAANEVAVAAFLDRRIPYLGIVKVVSRIVESHLDGDFISDERLTIEAVMNAAQWARTASDAHIASNF